MSGSREGERLREVNPLFGAEGVYQFQGDQTYKKQGAFNSTA